MAKPLIDGISADFLLADRGYDSNEIIDFAEANGMITVVPPKKNRKEQRFYDKAIYKVRHLVENAFLKLKRWRGVATRYAKTTSAFKGAVILACIVLWLRFLV
jgi:transposase